MQLAAQAFLPLLASCTWNWETWSSYAFIFEIWDTNGTKVWVALVCTFFDHHMEVATEMQLRWPQVGHSVLFSVAWSLAWPAVNLHTKFIAMHEYVQMGNFKVYTTFNKSLGQTAPSAWKCLKTQFWGPLTENLNPFQRSTHTLASSHPQ